MKVHFLNDSKQTIGGAWSFTANLIKALKPFEDVQVVNSISEADLCFLSGPTMVTKETINTVKELGKKLIVRLDNIPRNSRNRGAGTSRLKGYSLKADAIVWQCQWARDYIEPFIGRTDGKIIYNSVDESIFNPENRQSDPQFVTYIYSRFNRDETKLWEVAWYEFQRLHMAYEAADLLPVRLFLVGQFSPEQIEYGFDFFRGERVLYQGIAETPEEMAKYFKQCDFIIASYYNDCFPNTYLEALMCGVSIYQTPTTMTGGVPELLNLWTAKGREYFSLPRMGKEYYDLFKEVLGK